MLFSRLKTINFFILFFALLLINCGQDSSKAKHETLSDEIKKLPYALKIESLKLGPGSGFGKEKLPNIVLGPPFGEGLETGGLDVLSLGKGGEIILSFGDKQILDGDGPDFIVFENPFYPGGDPKQVFYELGEVSVSQDAKEWKSFPCKKERGGSRSFPGCAGWTPTLKFDAKKMLPLNPGKTGGDSFDLKDIGLKTAKFIKIKDLGEDNEAPSAGFDLDSVGLIHWEKTK